MIRWGIIGLGNIAQKFADTVNKMDAENILGAAASRDMQKAKEFADKYGIPEYFGSYESLCKSDKADAVYICTPNDLHYENCMTALENGKHVLCEKPFATDVEKAAEIYKYAEENGLFVMEALWTFHLPLLKKAAELIKSGEIGEVKHIRADYGFTVSGKRRERKFLSELGGGALLDVGIYNLGFAKIMYGADPVSIKTDRILNEYGTDSFGSVLAEYPNGGFAALTSSIGMKMPTEGVVYGTKGRICFHDHQKAEKMTVFYDDGTSQNYEMPFEINGFEYQIDECRKCIEKGMTESETYSHAESVGIIKTLDCIRAEWGMRFSFE